MSNEELNSLLERYELLINQRPKTLEEFNDIYSTIPAIKEAIVEALPEGTHPSEWKHFHYYLKHRNRFETVSSMEEQQDV